MDIPLSHGGGAQGVIDLRRLGSAIRLPRQIDSVLRTQVVQAESRGTAHPSPVLIRPGDSGRTEGERRPRTCNLRHPNHAHPAFFFPLPAV
jgi:hypothetical protein